MNEQLELMLNIKLNFESWGESKLATQDNLYIKCSQVINNFIHKLSTDNWSIVPTNKKACLKCCIKKALNVYNTYYKDNEEFKQLLVDLQQLDNKYQNNI